MSDSDDTDALLLVPPDFFYIHSDSEDNFLCDVSREQDSNLERMVVNDLIDHVSELENRVQVIEHKDSLNPYHSDSSFCGQCRDNFVDTYLGFNSLHLSRNNYRQNGSFENVRNYCTLHHSTPNMFTTPVKNRIPLSLPSTPSGGVCTAQRPTLKGSIQPETRYAHLLEVASSSGVTAITVQPIAQQNSAQESATLCETKQGQDLMCEIDEFLNSIKKKKPEEELQRSHQWQKNGESAFVAIDHTQTFPSVAQYGLSNDVNRLALSDVGRLLEEVGTTQSEIIHKLQEINKPLPEKSLSAHASFNTNASVPELLLQGESFSKILVDESTSNDVDTGCQQTDCSVTLTENTSNTNHKSVVKRPGLRSSRRRLDLSYEFSAGKTTEVGNGVIAADQPPSLSNTTLASSQSSAASKSHASSAIGSSSMPDGQDGGHSVIHYLPNSSRFAQEDEARADSGSAFATHTYPPLVPGRRGGPLLSHARSLEPGARVVLVPTTQAHVPNGARFAGQEDISQRPVVPSGTTKVFTSTDINKSVLGDPIKQESLKHSDGNESSKTVRDRALQDGGKLLSLSELWSGEEQSGWRKDDLVNPLQKLEEERYRRQHCEQQIRQLQGRLLEEEQKVAVAVEVDRAKDQAILQLEAGWRRLVGHWRELEEQRHSVTSTLHLERQAFQSDLAHASQRAKHLERELSRMLDLAQDYREKSEAIGRENEEIKGKHQAELQEAVTRVQQLEQGLSSMSEALKAAHAGQEELTGELLSAKQEADKDKQAKEAVFREMEQFKEMLAKSEAELLAVKEEKSSLQIKVKEEKNRNSLLEKQKKALQVALDDIKKREKAVREEVQATGERLERAKLELRDHYQQQVEKVVQEKMREFQAQLDADEASMRSELQQRERAITELAAQQIKQIADKHEVEVRLVEEKHREEQQLLRLQLSQCSQKVADLQATVAQLSSHRGQVAERLHAIMEAQWRESVRVIAGSSPLHPHRSGGGGGGDQAWEMPPLPLHHLEHSGSSSTTDTAPFSRDGQVTCRVKTSQSKSPADSGDQLKKYIAMLLDCKPGNPVGDLSEIPTSECGNTLARMQQDSLGVRLDCQDCCPVQGQVDHVNRSQPAAGSSGRESQAGKPPWK